MAYAFHFRAKRCVAEIRFDRQSAGRDLLTKATAKITDLMAKWIRAFALPRSPRLSGFRLHLAHGFESGAFCLAMFFHAKTHCLLALLKSCQSARRG
jgi:hypothetical protein